MKPTILSTLAFGLALAASPAVAGSDSPFGELGRYNDPMGSGPLPEVVAFPESASGGQTTPSFKVTPLSELSRYNDPMGSGTPSAAVESPDTQFASEEPFRGSRFWRWTSRNQPQPRAAY